MRVAIFLVVSALGCGGPVLRNAPRANPTVMAATAAAIAGAATLADPDAAARRQEQKKAGEVTRTREAPAEPMPTDVLDRLDQLEAGQTSVESTEPKRATDPSRPMDRTDWMPLRPPPRRGKARVPEPASAADPPPASGTR
jgi:hypothetical protein